MMAVLTDRLLKPVPELPPEITCGEEVRNLVRRMMAKDPADRHQDCEELQREIEEAAPGELVPAKIGRRAWAGMLDVLLVGLPIVAMWAIFQAITGYFPTTLLYDSVLGRVLLGLILLGWPCAYSVLLTDREGRTVGQRTQGIRTATRELEAPTRRRLLLRALAIWGPIALGMSIQTDWPPAAVGSGVFGVRALVVQNAPWLFVELWILVLLLMPHLHRNRRHVADFLSRTQIVEIHRPLRELTGGAQHHGWLASSLISRRSLARASVLLAWLAFAAFFVQQRSGLPGGFAKPGRIRETVVAGQPGWDRLLARFWDEFLGPGKLIENPEAVSLQRGLFFPLIYAFPTDALRVVNRPFGSSYFLKLRYASQEGRFVGGGSSQTRELAPSSPAEAAAWEEVRRKSYQGSLKHFMRALMHERLQEEGFEVMNPEDFRGLFRRERDFLLVADRRLQVRFAGDPALRSINFPGFVHISARGDVSGYWSASGNWGAAGSVPRSVLARYEAEQDSLWGRRTETIDRVLSLE